MACWLMAPNHYPDQYWLKIIDIHPSAISEKMRMICKQKCHLKHIFKRFLCICQGLYSLRRRRLTGIWISIINLRRSDDRLRFIMGIPILLCICQVLYSLRRRRLTGIGISIINLRRSDDRLRFIMGIPILLCICQGLYSLRRRRLTGIGISIINLRRSDDRLRFIMGIPILIRRSLLSE